MRGPSFVDGYHKHLDFSLCYNFVPVSFTKFPNASNHYFVLLLINDRGYKENNYGARTLVAWLYNRSTVFLNKNLRSRSVPIALFALCTLAYGVLLHRLGFYWDDWPWVWLNHSFGPQAMLSIDSLHRPLSGEILWFGAVLSGEIPLRWQWLNLAYRWLSSVAVFWAMLKIWPDQVKRAAIIAFLFLVYPGFTGQFVSINTSRHLLPLAFFFFSVGFMAWATREKKHAILLTILSLIFALLEVLSSDYYLGIELVRPLIIWFCIHPNKQGFSFRLKSTLLKYIPYFLFLLLVFTWRFNISRVANYPVTLTTDLANSPTQVLVQSLRTISLDSWTASLSAWSRIFEFPSRATFGLRNITVYILLIAVSAFLAFIFLYKLEDKTRTGRFWIEALLLGILSLLVGGLPFLVTGLSIDLVFPADRGTLPLMFGVSLLWASLLDRLFKNKAIMLAMTSLVIGLAVGAHFLTAISYQRDWETQRAFFEQLTWRVPNLKPGTALYYSYTIALRDFRSTDNSLTAPINWIYSPKQASNEIEYDIFDLRLRQDTILPEAIPGLPILHQYGDFNFRGSTDQVLVISFDPPACLRVLHPKYDALQPQLPDELISSLQISNLNLIDDSPVSPAQLPLNIFPNTTSPRNEWCYAFEKADLARQMGDWEKVVEIWDESLDLPSATRHASEFLPFIQGFAHTGKWQRAKALTLQAFDSNELMQPMLCFIWSDMVKKTPTSEAKNVILDSINKIMNCTYE